jgi:hypothetical protein
MVEESHFKASFVDYGLVDNLDYQTGTAKFWGKEIKYDRKNHHWTYLNNRPVNFHTPSERSTPAEEEDTVQVEELLEMTERVTVRPRCRVDSNLGSVFSRRSGWYR